MCKNSEHVLNVLWIIYSTTIAFQSADTSHFLIEDFSDRSQSDREEDEPPNKELDVRSSEEEEDQTGDELVSERVENAFQKR